MVMPKVDPAASGEVQAIEKLHEDLFRVLPFEYIDFDYSDYINLLGASWAYLPGLWDGDHQHQAAQLPIAPNNNFLFAFVKPIWLNWTLIQELVGNSITICRVRYVDDTTEFLVHGTLTLVGMPIYGTFAPPTKAMPVISMEFWNMNPMSATDLIELIITMTDTPINVSVNVSSMASANKYSTNQSITPIPAGLVGVVIAFGFASQAIVFHNNSADDLEISQDGGITWEIIGPSASVWFDWKKILGFKLRDPAGAGGQDYQMWAW